MSNEYISLHVGFSDEWYRSNSTCSFGLRNLVLLYIHIHVEIMHAILVPGHLCTSWARTAWGLPRVA